MCYMCEHACVCLFVCVCVCICLGTHVEARRQLSEAGPVLLPQEFSPKHEPFHQPCLVILKWYTFLIYLLIDFLPHTLTQRPGTMKAKWHPDDMTVTLRREGGKRAEASWDKLTEGMFLERKMRIWSKFCLSGQDGCDMCIYAPTVWLCTRMGILSFFVE